MLVLEYAVSCTWNTSFRKNVSTSVEDDRWLNDRWYRFTPPRNFQYLAAPNFQIIRHQCTQWTHGISPARNPYFQDCPYRCKGDTHYRKTAHFMIYVHLSFGKPCTREPQSRQCIYKPLHMHRCSTKYAALLTWARAPIIAMQSTTYDNPLFQVLHVRPEWITRATSLPLSPSKGNPASLLLDDHL